MSFSILAQTPQPDTFGKGTTLAGSYRIDPSGTPAAVINPDWAPFFHGVASGDPLADRVIIWTRVTPPELHTEQVEVDWTVATDTALVDVVASGTFLTGAERDFTVKVDVSGLAAGTTYYYGFEALDAHSLTGKTKTTPVSTDVDHLKFGVVSCANYQAGYFNGYGRLADRTDLDAVLHLGDYIYEYEDFRYGSDSVWNDRLLSPSTEIISLEDYRNRYATYRLDPDLARMHQQHAMIAVWDDHESANDSYVDGAQNHTEGEEGSWEDRKAIARQVYYEWMPIRETAEERLYRSFQYGNLVDLIMLDTRLEGRDQQVESILDSNLYNPNRTLLGEEQRDWLFDQLQHSEARWKVVGQQVVFSEFNVGWAGAAIGATFEDTESTFLDIWDGYPAERERVAGFIDSFHIDNVVLLTGDFHSTFAFDVAVPPVELDFQEVPGAGLLPFYNPTPEYDPETGEGSIAVEFATPSISSANFDENTTLETALALQAQINTPIQPNPLINLGNPNPHLKYVDLVQHGYYLLDIRPDSAQANYYFTPILEVSDQENFGDAYYSLSGTNHLRKSNTASPPKTQQDIPAPTNPPQNPNSTVRPSHVIALSLYPNPSDGLVNLRFALDKTVRLRVDLLDQQGRSLRSLLDRRSESGLYTLTSDISDLPAGLYVLRLHDGSTPLSLQLIKR